MSAPDAIATIDAWREQGAQHIDPVRFRTIEALARRATGHAGEARRLIDARLAERLAAYGALLAARAAMPVEAGAAGNALPRSAVAALVDRLAEREPATARVDETLGYLRNTWSRLSAEQRLVQSLATVPGNAGPLNSHHLAHRALTVMRDLSPGYLSRFMAYVDTLLWLDQANSSAVPAGAGTTAAGPDKASAPARAVKRRSTPAPR